MRRIGNGGLGRKHVEYKKYSHVVLKEHKQCQGESVDSLVKFISTILRLCRLFSIFSIQIDSI